MSMSPYVASIRARIGNALLLMPSVTGAVIHEGRLLLARHVEDEVWSFVGGSVEPDEEPAAAALRELTEETGLVGELLGIVGCYGGPDYRITYANGDVVAFVDTVYACRLLAGEVHLEEAEISEIGWFDHTKSRPRQQPPTTRTPTDSCGQTAGSANSGKPRDP
jgi:8-oxo-dGTP pyrophosphatase MutT (NUDIX family)